uniref:Tyrosine-protein phosphatase domain-containing protein n=1 Tax=Setaria digitata TaxID=48799 RepID=A0A915Q7T5_9BILA
MLNGVLQQYAVNSNGHNVDLLDTISMNGQMSIDANDQIVETEPYAVDSTIRRYMDYFIQSNPIPAGYINASNIQEFMNSTSPLYWPQKLMGKLRLSDHSLILLSSSTSKHQMTMIFQLKHNASGERRTIYHLRLMDWESGGVPPSEESFLGFMDAVNSVRRHLENEHLRKISFGLNLTDLTDRNRTQTTNFDYCKCMLIDASKTLAILRQQRICLVENVKQYRFVYSVLDQRQNLPCSGATVQLLSLFKLKS